MIVMTRNSLFGAWSWESYDDSEISCETSSPISDDRCDGSEVDEADEGGPDIYAFTSEEAVDLRASRAALDACIRDTLKIATGIAPSCGISPVGMEGAC